jgi:hypothetical protein
LEKSLRPVLFFGNNWISLIGGALTTASAFVLIGFWVVSIFGHAGRRTRMWASWSTYACRACLCWG